MFEKLSQVWSFIQAALKALPKVIDIAKRVEEFLGSANGEDKKNEALKLAKEIPAPKGWCKEDWQDFLSGLIDATVAVLHWRGVFKHKPDHPCYK